MSSYYRHSEDSGIPYLSMSSTSSTDLPYWNSIASYGLTVATRMLDTLNVVWKDPHDPHQTPFESGLAWPSTRMSPLRVPSAITPVVSENATCVMSSGRNRSEFLCMRSRAPLKTRLVGHTSLPRTPPSLRSHVEHARALNRHPAPS